MVRGKEKETVMVKEMVKEMEMAEEWLEPWEWLAEETGLDLGSSGERTFR